MIRIQTKDIRIPRQFTGAIPAGHIKLLDLFGLKHVVVRYNGGPCTETHIGRSLTELAENNSCESLDRDDVGDKVYLPKMEIATSADMLEIFELMKLPMVVVETPPIVREKGMVPCDDTNGDPDEELLTVSAHYLDKYWEVNRAQYDSKRVKSLMGQIAFEDEFGLARQSHPMPAFIDFPMRRHEPPSSLLTMFANWFGVVYFHRVDAWHASAKDDSAAAIAPTQK